MVLLWGHIPEGLAKILYPPLEDGRIERISGKVIGCERPAPEGNMDDRGRYWAAL